MKKSPCSFKSPCGKDRRTILSSTPLFSMCVRPTCDVGILGSVSMLPTPLVLPTIVSCCICVNLVIALKRFRHISCSTKFVHTYSICLNYGSIFGLVRTILPHEPCHLHLLQSEPLWTVINSDTSLWRKYEYECILYLQTQQDYRFRLRSLWNLSLVQLLLNSCTKSRMCFPCE